VKLNLGCSDQILPGYGNVDIAPPADQIVDLCERWPWADNSVDEIRAFDIIEHLVDPIHTMNEAFRVLTPGGRFDIEVPTTDGRGWAQDPGHICWPPWNRNSFFYYEHGNPHQIRFSPSNGVRCAFGIVFEHERMLADRVSKLHIILEAVK
jgi:SAM-dependent methyltransferase